jgi:N-acetylmuramoyl-L-alanine amidase
MNQPAPTPRHQRVFRLGDSGPAVAEIRTLLDGIGVVAPGTRDSGTADTGNPAFGEDVFDADLERAVRAFQQQRGLIADGVVGPSTYRAIDEARWRLGDRLLVHVPGALMSGDDVLTLQQRLLGLGFRAGRADGLFGARTEQALRDFQRNIGVPADGTCGPATLKALARLAPRVEGGRPNALRAEERLRRAGPQLSGKVVVIDAAAPPVAHPELAGAAAAVTEDLAARIEGRLTATGVQAFLTHPAGQRPDAAPSEVHRAEFANRTAANLCVSLHVDAADNPGPSGVATYFYGVDTRGIRSTVGERFASLVQREIVARTDLVDLRTHAQSWDLLRRTRMPAVRIDVGYLTNPQDAARLADPAFRDVVAEAVVVAVQRVYLTPETDTKTGVLRLSELREAVNRSTPPG